MVLVTVVQPAVATSKNIRRIGLHIVEIPEAEGGAIFDRQ